MDKFIGYSFVKLIQEEIEKLSSIIKIKEIQFLMKIFFKKKFLGKKDLIKKKKKLINNVYIQFNLCKYIVLYIYSIIIGICIYVFIQLF